MDWLAKVDAYCERLGPEYWSEPVNAVTNLAFVIAAAVMWRHARGLGRAMCVLLAVIGVGSWLFHTHANRLTGVMDTTPILAFILLYIFAASRDLLGLKGWQAGIAVLAFFPFSALLVPVFRELGMGSSAGYAPVPVLIAIYALLLWRRAPATARGLAVGAAILCVSLAARMADQPVCSAFPLGTHFIWHLLNALMLGWMIGVHAQHMAGQGGDRPPQAR